MALVRTPTHYGGATAEESRSKPLLSPHFPILSFPRTQERGKRAPLETETKTRRNPRKAQRGHPVSAKKTVGDREIKLRFGSRR